MHKLFVLFCVLILIVFTGCSNSMYGQNKADIGKMEVQTQIPIYTESTPEPTPQTTVSSNVRQESETKVIPEVKPEVKPEVEKEPDYSDWVPYSAGDLKTLVDNILKGYVVYYNGQYLASPEYVKMLENSEIIYENDISSGVEEHDRYDLAE